MKTSEVSHTEMEEGSKCNALFSIGDSQRRHIIQHLICLPFILKVTIQSKTQLA